MTDTLYSTTAQFSILHAPTSSDGTTFGPGSTNNLLKSNGTSVYWTTLAASDIPNISTDKLTSGTLGVARGGTGAASFTVNSVIISGTTATAPLTTRAIYNRTSKGNLEWTANTTDTHIITKNTLAYWDGSYSGTSSNLTYCVKGAFGDAVTYGVDDATANGALGTGTGLTTERSVYYGLVTVNNASQTRATGIYAPTSAGTANQILVSAGGTSAPTWKATANGAAYATSANGALTFGTLPVAQGGTGVFSIANIRAGKDGDGNTISSTYVKLNSINSQTITGGITLDGILDVKSPILFRSGLDYHETINDVDEEVGRIEFSSGASPDFSIILKNISTTDNSTLGADVYLISPSTATDNEFHWYYFLTSKNYTDYTVTKTGSGASGTWGINISGKATQDSDGNTISSTYLKKSGGTMTGNLVVEKVDDAVIQSHDLTSDTKVSLEAYKNGKHGIYSNGYYNGTSFVSSSSWLIYRNSSGNVIVPGHATSDLPLTGGTMTGTLKIAGQEFILGTNSSSSNDSGDLVWQYGSGQEKMRIWTPDSPTTKTGPYFRVYNASGTSLYSGVLPLGDGTGASGTWGINVSGNAATATKATQDGSDNTITSTYLKLAGGTMTGLLTLSYNYTSLYFKNPDIKTMTTSNNEVSSGSESRLSFYNSNSSSWLGSIGQVYSTNGDVYGRIYVRNYLVDGSQVNNYFSVYSKKDGTLSYAVANKPNFRNAIGASNGIWPINAGGTGSNSAAGARANLGAAPEIQRDVVTSTPDSNGNFSLDLSANSYAVVSIKITGLIATPWVSSDNKWHVRITSVGGGAITSGSRTVTVYYQAL